MLFLSSRILEHELSDEARLRLLGKLQERDFTPLIRSTRLNCYEQALLASNQSAELERLIAASINSDEQISYVQGELFCFDDHTFFLLFDDLENGSRGMRAGIVYEAQTAEPLRKLNVFCQTVGLCLAESLPGEGLETGESLQTGESFGAGATNPAARWQDPWAMHEGFMRFVARQDSDSLSTIACRENARERIRAARLLDDDVTRLFLRRAKEAYAEGFPVIPSADATNAPPEFTVNELVEAGLLRREVLISCRKSGHTLFSLPSADALAVITISHASCSECGASIADEKIEEVLAPSQFASILLEDGAWLVNRLHSILRELGISESDIAVEPPAGDGEARMMVRVCGETFLIVMRDGDLTPAFARRAINTKLETEARHMVIVVTGAIHNEGRVGLLSFANRLTRGGNDFEMIIAQGVSAAATEIRRAFEHVSQKVLAEYLSGLDASLGLSVARLITARFQMLRGSGAAARPAELAAPAEPVQSLQKMAQAVSLIDFELLDINNAGEERDALAK